MMTPEEFGQTLFYWWILASGILFNVLMVCLFFVRIGKQIRVAAQARRIQRREREAERRLRGVVGPNARWVDVEILPPPPRESRQDAFSQ